MHAPSEWTGLSGWGLGQWGFVLAAFAALVLGAGRSSGIGGGMTQRARAVRLAPIVAVLVCALWALIEATYGPGDPAALIADVARNLACLGLVYALFVDDGRHETVAPVRPVLIVLAVVECLQPVLLVLRLRLGLYGPPEPHGQVMIFEISVILRLLVITGALVLVHNLYVGAMGPQRQVVRWTCGALALIWGYDLNFYTMVYLVNAMPAQLVGLRALVALLGMGVLGMGAMRERSQARFSPSRAVAFQSLSLLVIGGYMLLMVAVAQSVAWLGGGATMLTQLGFVFATTVLVLVLVPSQRLRGWLNVMVSKHFFQHRYDYRAEWLRFTRTIGQGHSVQGLGGQETGDATSLHARVVQALADITDSPRGALLVPADNGDLVLAARWQWPTLDVPAQAMPVHSVAFFEQSGFIVDLDEVRRGVDHRGETRATPGWMAQDEAIWALVPLVHFDRLVGLVALGRPPLARKLDWEDFDLLRVAGHQIASTIAENNGQLALLEASRFDEFNRRIAFVMHDIKNLASQLSFGPQCRASRRQPRIPQGHAAHARQCGRQAQCPARAALALWDGPWRRAAGPGRCLCPGPAPCRAVAGDASRCRRRCGQGRSLSGHGQPRDARTSARPPRAECARCQRAGHACPHRGVGRGRNRHCRGGRQRLRDERRIRAQRAVQALRVDQAGRLWHRRVRGPRTRARDAGLAGSRKPGRAGQPLCRAPSTCRPISARPSTV
jgi:putative PEP-CTERM system histidine kinase